MLLNATKYQGYTAFTVSELLRENQQGGGNFTQIRVKWKKTIKNFLLLLFTPLICICPFLEEFPQEAVVRRCSVKSVFLKILQNSHENTCARVTFFNKLAHLQERLWYKCFPINFAKFLRTPIFIEHLWWLLLFPPLSLAKVLFQGFRFLKVLSDIDC